MNKQEAIDFLTRYRKGEAKVDELEPCTIDFDACSKDELKRLYELLYKYSPEFRNHSTTSGPVNLQLDLLLEEERIFLSNFLKKYKLKHHGQKSG